MFILHMRCALIHPHTITHAGLWTVHFKQTWFYFHSAELILSIMLREGSCLCIFWIFHNIALTCICGFTWIHVSSGTMMTQLEHWKKKFTWVKKDVPPLWTYHISQKDKYNLIMITYIIIVLWLEQHLLKTNKQKKKAKSCPHYNWLGLYLTQTGKCA